MHEKFFETREWDGTGLLLSLHVRMAQYSEQNSHSVRERSEQAVILRTRSDVRSPEEESVIQNTPLALLWESDWSWVDRPPSRREMR